MKWFSLTFCITILYLLILFKLIKNAHTGEIFSPFVADFLGELIIRTNLDKFTDKLTRMHHDSFVYAVKGGETETCHKRFGMKVKDGMISFRFHISLLHEILTEDFRQVMG